MKITTATSVVFFLVVATAFAQRDRDRGFDPKEILFHLDTNRDGMIAPTEVSPRAADWINRLAKRSRLDTRQPMSLQTLTSAAVKEREEKDRAREKASKTNLLPGFGEESDLPLPLGFNIPKDSPLASRVPLEERYDEKILETVNDMLRRYDRDKSGVLERDEWDGGRWRTDPSTSDLNKDGKLNKVELCERIAGFQGNSKAESSSSSSSSRTSGFGATSSRGSSTSSSSSSDDKIRKYAESLMKQYDRNKNRVLEKDEWEKMRGNPGEGDLNKDGRLSLDELTLRLKNYSKSKSSSTSSSSPSKPSFIPKKDDKESRYSRYRSYSSKKEDKKEEGNYRFLTPTERLPKDIPSWFSRNDADADGQVKMSEYSTVWTDAKVEEFRTIDANNDGFITPAEAIAAEK